MMLMLSGLWNNICQGTLPFLREELGTLSDKLVLFVAVIEGVAPHRFMQPYSWQFVGRKRLERLAIVKAFIAKAVYDFSTTRTLIDQLKNCPKLRRLCGWDSVWEIPSESTFSRAFAEFAQTELPQKIQQATVEQHIGEKLFGHNSRDSTAIAGREKPAKKEKKAPPPARKRGRPRKGEERKKDGVESVKRLDLQPLRTLEENLEDLPKVCDVGTKRNSKGHKTSWIGYKLHLDVVDGDIPVSALLTSASLHDSQAAIPLAQMTEKRIVHLYDLMDSAYDADPIHQFSKQLGNVPIIDHNKRRGQKRQMDPATARRYNERSSAERVNSDLKDNHGGRHVRVRSHAKVAAHLFFGLIVVTVKQIFRLLN